MRSDTKVDYLCVMETNNNGKAPQGGRHQMTPEQVKQALQNDLQVIAVLVHMLRNSDRLLTVIAEEMAAIENDTRDVLKAKKEAGVMN